MRGVLNSFNNYIGYKRQKISKFNINNTININLFKNFKAQGCFITCLHKTIPNKTVQKQTFQKTIAKHKKNSPIQNSPRSSPKNIPKKVVLIEVMIVPETDKKKKLNKPK